MEGEQVFSIHAWFGGFRRMYLFGSKVDVLNAMEYLDDDLDSVEEDTWQFDVQGLTKEQIEFSTPYATIDDWFIPDSQYVPMTHEQYLAECRKWYDKLKWKLTVL